MYETIRFVIRFYRHYKFKCRVFYCLMPIEQANIERLFIINSSYTFLQFRHHIVIYYRRKYVGVILWASIIKYATSHAQPET